MTLDYKLVTTRRVLRLGVTLLCWICRFVSHLTAGVYGSVFVVRVLPLDERHDCVVGRGMPISQSK